MDNTEQLQDTTGHQQATHWDDLEPNVGKRHASYSLHLSFLRYLKVPGGSCYRLFSWIKPKSWARVLTQEPTTLRTTRLPTQESDDGCGEERPSVASHTPQYAPVRKQHEINNSIVDIMNVSPWIIKVSDFCFFGHSSVTSQLLDVFLGSEYLTRTIISSYPLPKQKITFGSKHWFIYLPSPSETHFQGLVFPLESTSLRLLPFFLMLRRPTSPSWWRVWA